MAIFFLATRYLQGNGVEVDGLTLGHSQPKTHKAAPLPACFLATRYLQSRRKVRCIGVTKERSRKQAGHLPLKIEAR